ncbi:MAG: hypothetical protein GXP45_06155 [bacterium]|nr:hypothetical protein [bacterium]
MKRKKVILWVEKDGSTREMIQLIFENLQDKFEVISKERIYSPKEVTELKTNVLVLEPVFEEERYEELLKGLPPNVQIIYVSSNAFSNMPLQKGVLFFRKPTQMKEIINAIS